MKRPTFLQYLTFRLGIKGESGKEIFGKLLSKPFQAASLRDFWYHWNPFYTYILSYFVYRPLRKILPNSIAMLLTFILCGYLLHDVFNMLLALPRAGFHLPFPRSGILFLLFGLFMVITDALGLNFKSVPRGVRPLIHVFCLASIFTVSYFLNGFLQSIFQGLQG